jgi:uncharacterized cupin superfamily protein
MLNDAQGNAFFTEWIAAWNARDLERVLAHYHEDFEMTSPVIVQIAGEPSGTLRGKAAVADYWRRALAHLPNLHFEPVGLTLGMDALTMIYRNQRGQLVSERVEFDPDGRVIRASASYQAPAPLAQIPSDASGRPVALRAIDAPLRARPSVYPEPFASRMAGREKRPLGDLFGLANFGVNLTRIRPGGSSALRHAHSRQDEFIYILEGHPTLHTDAGLTPLAPGFCAGFKAGTGDGHRLINPTASDVLYLEIGDRSPDDTGSYPDDDLAATRVNNAWVFTHKDGTPY